jgi:hypothetical protein
MNTDICLLFYLDIPVDFINKLGKYYYIPENRINSLKPGGFVYFVDRLKPNKSIRYCGILLGISEKGLLFRDGYVDYSNYHVFYRPKLSRIGLAVALLNKTDYLT